VGGGKGEGENGRRLKQKQEGGNVRIRGIRDGYGEVFDV
jgi:hypothetical protein